MKLVLVSCALVLSFRINVCAGYVLLEALVFTSLCFQIKYQRLSPHEVVVLALCSMLDYLKHSLEKVLIRIPRETLV